MKVQIVRRVHFSAAHSYENPKWDDALNRAKFGSCFSRFGHGHNYVIQVHIEGPIDPDTGMILDLRDIDAAIEVVVAPLRNRHLNKEVAHFKTSIPTTENIAIYFLSEIQALLTKHNDVYVKKVCAFESENLWAEATV